MSLSSDLVLVVTGHDVAGRSEQKSPKTPNCYVSHAQEAAMLCMQKNTISDRAQKEVHLADVPQEHPSAPENNPARLPSCNGKQECCKVTLKVVLGSNHVQCLCRNVVSATAQAEHFMPADRQQFAQYC